VETFNKLLNPLNLPYVEASAINGVGVFETLKEAAKLTVPMVKEKVLGIKPRAEDLAAEERRIQEAVKEADPKEVEVAFVRSGEDYESQVRKMKLRSLQEIEKEIEKLSREFLDKSKKPKPS
jgi:hypothetical protein